MNTPKLESIFLYLNGLSIAYDPEGGQLGDITAELNKKEVTAINLLWYKSIFNSKEIRFYISRFQEWYYPITVEEYVDLAGLTKYKQQLLPKVRKHVKNT